MQRLLVVIAALLACSGANAEVTTLYCDASLSDAPRSALRIAIDHVSKVADTTHMKSENEAEAETFLPIPYDVSLVSPSLIAINRYKLVGPGLSYQEIAINRISLFAVQTYRNYETHSNEGVYAKYQCELIETPKAEF